MVLLLMANMIAVRTEKLLLFQIAKIRIPAKAENIVKIMIGWFILDICISYLFYLYQLTLIRWRFANILSWNISIVVSELLLTGIDLLDIGFVHFLCINQSSLLSICMDLTSNKEDIQVVDICYKI